MNKYVSILVILFLPFSVHAICTESVKIKELKPRSDGWVHIVAEGMSDIDISKCGSKNSHGMLLNFNDTTGSTEGKKMLLSFLLSVHIAGKPVKLCSTGCDTQHASYSRLDHIDGIE